MSHLPLSLLLAALVAGAAAVPGTRHGRERVYVAVYVFVSCIVSTFAVGWLMHVIHQ